MAYEANYRFLYESLPTLVVLDPVSSLNNVTSRISEDECLEIVAAAKAAWQTAHFASTEEDSAIWKELFGPGFKVEE